MYHYRYGWFDEIVDSGGYLDKTYSITTRTGGAIQLGFGLGEMAAGGATAITCPTGIGCAAAGAIIIVGFDQANAGMKILIDGKVHNTVGAAGLANLLNISESDAETIYAVASAAITVKALQKGIGNLATSNISKQQLDDIVNKSNYGYKPSGDGVIVGPKGGIYTQTTRIDEFGDTVYSNNGKLYTFDDSGKKIEIKASQTTDLAKGSRYTYVETEKYVQDTLSTDFRPQVSYLNGKEVPYGTPGSTRPDFCSPQICIEVKNYDLNLNVNGLVNKLAEQAKARQQHLPENITQKVYLDTRGQTVSEAQLDRVKDLIVQKSNGIIKRNDIEFL